MPEFSCVTCGTAFSLPESVLERYPGWEPKYCREHSPSRGGDGKKKKKRKPRPKPSATKEENLPLAEVLARYTDGPDAGVFTDGACVPNPGPGGWGVVHVDKGEVVEHKHGYDDDTTNNRMEMTALIEALEMLPEDADVTVYSDSQLCLNTLNQWAAGWEKRGWKRKGGPIKNLDLVQRAFALKKAHPRVKLEYVAAHAGNRWNEYADSLATAWMREEL